MAAKPKDVEEIYNAVLQKKSPQERSALLDAVCRDDTALRARVEELLKAHDQAGDFLAAPAMEAHVTLDEIPLTEGPGTIIGKYKLLEKIGEGGMGVVYMAEQKEPVRRKVALKIIKLGMDTKQVIARFEAERQALALMDHPNIAKVLDAGATDTGRPYFVMELVRGIPITEYCDKNNLNTRQRLDLFIPVCQAIQHAHQKGIIHRDIKPTNIMVTLHSSKPVPKIIDFGIAKATNQQLTEKTVFTRYAQMIGTPEYMSPEQAEMSGLEIDTRSDIYSLGVLLYELLTGATPLDAVTLRNAGYARMQQIIREEEPDIPSTKLSSLGPALTEIAKHRSTHPDNLRKLIKGDLDWIIMKSLEKDLTRRYDTAAEFAADIERHLKNEPVSAAAPGNLYRLRKFIRRNRIAVIAASLVITALIIGAITTTIGFVQANNQRQRAEAGFQSALEQRRIAENQQQRAEGNFVLALQALNDIILEDGSKLEIGQTFELLEELSNQSPQAPDYREGLVNCYVELATGQPENTDQIYQNALAIIENLQAEITDGPDKHMLLALIHHDLGKVLKKSDQWEKAADHYEQAEMFSDNLSVKYDFRSDLAQNYYQIGVKLCQPLIVEKLRQRGESCLIRVLDIQMKLVTDFPEVAKYRQDLEKYARKANAWAWSRASRFDYSVQYPARAVLLAEKVVQVRPEKSSFWNTLGVAYYRAGQWADAITAAGKSMDLKDGYPYVDDFFVLALAYGHIGDKEQALRWYDQAEEWVKNNLGLISSTNDSDQFRAEAEVLLGITERRNPANASEWYKRGVVHGKFSQWEQAQASFKKAIEINYNYSYGVSWYRLAQVQMVRGDNQGYRRTCARMLELFGQTNMTALLSIPDIVSFLVGSFS